MNAYNKIRKGSNTTYARWCEKKNIIYANKTIPKSWLLPTHTNPALSADQVMQEPLTTTEAGTVSVATVTMEEEDPKRMVKMDVEMFFVEEDRFYLTVTKKEAQSRMLFYERRKEVLAHLDQYRDLK